MLDLHTLGKRIILLGPSNAGKSTLALALSDKLGVPVVHLDQLQHLPDTDWQPRPEEEFKQLHDDAICADAWVMDGNYSRLMPQRFERATGAILITSNRWVRLARYLKRTMINASARAGHLDGGRDRVTWRMIDWILFKTPNNAAKYASAIQRAGIPAVECHSIEELKALYRLWGLRTDLY